jgi:tRNA-modifying protein YgfZ
MSQASSTVTLETLGVLGARGADARAFLQGQLSNDLTRLNPRHSLLAGYHNPQGRVIALLRLVERADDDFLLVLPRELIAALALRLGKFVLRAKVTLTDESAAWRVQGLTDPAGAVPGALALAHSVNAVSACGAGFMVCIAPPPSPRWLLIAPQDAPAAAAGAVTESVWRALAIAHGEPQVYARTSEQFVAQMLNLDALGAIAFDKGCYTGQEVIARAHYRGRVKRRLQRFRSTTPVTLAPGDSVHLTDGRSAQVVDASSLPQGRAEFLAVTTLPDGASAESAAQGGALLEAEALPLPYPLPE